MIYRFKFFIPFNRPMNMFWFLQDADEAKAVVGRGLEVHEISCVRAKDGRFTIESVSLVEGSKSNGLPLCIWSSYVFPVAIEDRRPLAERRGQLSSPDNQRIVTSFAKVGEPLDPIKDAEVLGRILYIFNTYVLK
ncbi:MAG: hypothetical protein ABIH41_06000 [Nanoarchaeota archaeon]